MNTRLILLLSLICLIVCGCGRTHIRHGNNATQNSTAETIGANPVIGVDTEPNVPNTPIVQVANVRIALPLREIYVNSVFGEREDPFTGKMKMHNGLDLSASGDSALAMLPGKVLDAGEDKNAGKFVLLQHGEISIAYCHLSKIFVQKGQNVMPGSMLGITGSTGRSSGEHLHLTCRLGREYIDPYIIISAIQAACGQAKEGEECTIEDMLF